MSTIAPIMETGTKTLDKPPRRPAAHVAEVCKERNGTKPMVNSFALCKAR